MVAVGQRGTVNMPLPVRVLRRRHRLTAVDAHHHADGVVLRGDGKARGGVVSLVVAGGTGVVAQGDHRRRHAGVHRDGQRGGGLHVPRVVSHLHGDAVVAVRQLRGGKGPLALSLHGVIGGAVDKNLHLRHIRIDIPQRKGWRGVVRDVVAVEAAAV